MSNKYDFASVEPKWQKYWEEHGSFRAKEDHTKPKFYALVEFPYPSGHGMHVGHIKAYSGLEVVSRKRRMQGYNVLFPIGFDAYGLPTENTAIKTGVHPRKVTDDNIVKFTGQLKRVGFSFDWSRVIDTTDEQYYKWTQWIFLKMFEKGLVFRDRTLVNYCPHCKVVLSNEDSQGGKCDICHSEVVQKSKDVWYLRITQYADKLLEGLKDVDYPDNVKQQQIHWIGKSKGAFVNFDIDGIDEKLEIYTTRPDTLFGVTFMVLAPESELVQQLTTADQKAEVDAYLDRTKKRTERERIADRQVTGVFSGSYAINPFTGEAVPIWISDYVLAGYGTGAIMAVPAHDSRDYAFAKHFGLEIRPLVEGCDVSEESFDAKEGIVCNSPRAGVTPYCDLSLNGLTIKEAIAATKKYVKDHDLGRVKINYRLRDAIFSRQRYWGEPFPVYYDADGMPQMLPEECLPLLLPEVDKFLPTETGEPPLGHAVKWAWDTVNQKVTEVSKIDNQTIFPLELCTMPGFAGSSAYYLRYMDPRNDKALVAKDVDEYWRNVDLYIGGTEHATGHLIYSRFWNKFLFDLGIVCEEEPFKKLINQGMIQGRSNFVYRINGTNKFVSLNLKDQYEVTPIHVDVNIVSNDLLDIEAFKNWRPEYNDAEFVLEDGKYICGWAVEKMSKSMFNVVNPDMIVEKYGADTLRLYEMFLGPLEQSKPWDTNGIDGVHRFLKKLWGLFFGNTDTLQVTDAEPTADELKSLHKLIKKVTFDIEHFSYNTSISAFMICVNELTSLKCSKRAILEPLITLLAPFAPHITEELWHQLGHDTTICDAQWPEHNEEYLVEKSVTYVISFNGKARFNLELPADISREDAEKAALSHENSAKWMEGKTVKKVIVVPGKIVNIVVG